MKNIVFDSSSIISLTMNNLLWTLLSLKENFNGDFYICKAVKAELVDNPLNTKRFEFNALQVLQAINSGVLNVAENEDAKNLSSELLGLANTCFRTKGSWINIVHRGEIESLATSIILKSSAYVVDERTTRLLIEEPKRLKDLLQSKLHSRVEVNQQNIRRFRELVRNVKIIRSVELIVVAYEHGFLDKYLVGNGITNPKRVLLDALLWGLKLRGCAVSKNEIHEIIRMESG